MMANQVLYGFVDLQDALAELVTKRGITVINAAIDRTLAEHNRQMTTLLALFATTTTDFKRRYKTPVAARLQPVDEHGRARPIRTAGFYDIAFPMQRGGTAWGTTYETSLKETVGDVNNRMNTLLTADARWLRDHILAALFVNSSWTFADEEHGSLTIKGLANNDSDTYLIQDGADAGATDNHYLAQANAIDNSNDPFGTIHDELMEHPENSGDVIAFVPTNLKASVKGLTGFYPVSDDNIRYGANVSTLQSSLGAAIPGTVFGYHDDGVWLVEWKAMPSSYIAAVATEGDRPLAMRQDTTSELQGFNRVGDRNDHPYYEAQYLRKAGFGGQNRVGALVYRIGNGSYAVPTGYASPMA
ncbi:MAG: hypothetical protein KF832_12595 [Caldilineaceae bacterium]|nr:hypothetical protein [Caldilineaceae bacterium]